MNNKNPDFLVRAEILRLLPVHRTHTQLALIERDDPQFPRAIVLGSKRFYHRDQIERWLSKTFGETHVRVTDSASMKKPSPRPAKRKRHVRDRV